MVPSAHTWGDHMRYIPVFAVLAGPAAALDLPAALTDADFMPVSRIEAELGQLLFYDPILSGQAAA